MALAEVIQLRSHLIAGAAGPAGVAAGAAYFDLGVARGVAEARAERLRGGRAVEQLSNSIVHEALGAGVAREDAVAAAVLAT